MDETEVEQDVVVGRDDEAVFTDAARLYAAGEFKRSLLLYTYLANRGRVGCQRFVGWMYFCGEGVERDIDKASEWFCKAANEGDREAKFGLGRVALLKGTDKVAVEWFSAAHQEGFVPATFRLGWMYKCGRGCEKDASKAFALFQKAYAEGGHLPAGRAFALMLVAGHNGAVGRLVGAFLLCRVVFQVLVTSMREPDSKRFMM